MLESLLWYSRYSVWVGAIVLTLQAITGRSVGLITLLAVLLLGLGFLAFIGVLSWEGLGLPLQLEPAVVEDEAPNLAAGTPPASRPVIRASETRPVPQRADDGPGRNRATGNAKQESGFAETPKVQGEPVTPRLPTQALGADSPLIGASCSACAKRLREGQVVVRCPECGAIQHASCWSESGFHCGVEDCTGHGSLATPDET